MEAGKIEALRRDLSEADQDVLHSCLIHELLNALTAVLGHLELVQKLSRLDEEGARSIAVAFSQARRCERLVREIGSLRSWRPELGWCDAASKVQECAAALKRRADSGNVDIRTMGPASGLYVALPGEALSRILSNLLRDLVDSMPPGTALGVASGAEESGRIAVEIRCDCEAGLFERRALSDVLSSAAGSRKAVGLGFHLASRLTRSYGGDLEVLLPPDGGTRFIVRLPPSNEARRPAH